MTSDDTSTLDRLAALRPDGATADRLWPAPDRERTLADVLDGTVRAGGRGPRRGRRVAVGLVAAVAVGAAVLAVTVVAPGGGTGGATSAAAAEIHRLALRAGATPADRIAPDQFWHTVVTESQQNVGDGPAVSKHRMEAWTGADGATWRRDTGSGRTDTYLFPASGTPSVSSPTPAFLATLPTDPTALRHYLDHHVSGSESHDEAVFVGVGDMLRAGYADPRLRAAALTVLADLKGVDVDMTATDASGRPGVGLVWTRPDGGSTETLVVDPTTSRVLGEQMRMIGGAKPVKGVVYASGFASVNVSEDVADRVPADVVETAVPQH